ncbi:MAG: hypothetical protein AUH32_02110 [Actinobacteria bacterium 13_1_40CM_66_12]|nr:MAG: hypothetical protein AUH32_02110 [Actinobacteria bacterium 13_1_40CM_66_12]
MLGLWSVLHASSRLGCVNLLLRYGLVSVLRLGFGCGRRCRLGRSVFGRSLSRVNELGDAGLDRFVCRQLRLGVELELALRPGERIDDSVVARLPVALSMEEMAEEKVQRGRLTVAIAKGKGTCRPLALGGFQKRAKRDFGERAV